MSHRPRNGWVHAERRQLLPNTPIVSFFSSVLDPSNHPLIPLPTTSATTPESQTQSSVSLSSNTQTSSSVTSSSSTSSKQASSISSIANSSSSSSSPIATATATNIATNTNSATAAVTPTANPTLTPTSVSVSQSIYETTSNGQVLTLTSFVNAPAATSSTSSATAAPTTQSFLQNKALSGVVFGLVGLLGLIAILALAIFTVRRRRNKRLLREAISFDPTSVNDYVAEKDRNESVGFGRSSNDHGHSGIDEEAAAAYPFGVGHGYGYTDHGVKVPQQPPRVLSPQGQARNPTGEMLPNPTHGEGIGWAPDPTPFMPTQLATNYSTGDAGANRILKIAND